MSYVANTQNTQKQAGQNQVAKELQDLENQLMAAAKQAQDTTELMQIEEALGKVQKAKEVTIAKSMQAQAQASRARVGQMRAQSPAINTTSDLQAQNIQKIRNVRGSKLQTGDVFSSYNGFGLSNMGYMKANLAGLDDLLNSKK